MTHFEPTTDEIIKPADERMLRLENEYSDEELLLELRRRGRLARVETEIIVDQRYVDDGYPIEQQIQKAWHHAGNEAARLHCGGTTPTGAKVDSVKGDGVNRPGFEKGRRVRFAVNYVVDRK